VAAQTQIAFSRSTGLIGIVLVLIFWPLNWLLPGLRTAYLFFPLWLGYTLVVDGIVLKRTGTSLLARSPAQFLLLFFISAPCWWLFEIINWRTQNWIYLGSGAFTEIEYWVLCSLSFSTVMPAVFETSELALSFGWIQRFRSGFEIHPTRKVMLMLFLGGAVMAMLTMLWPRWFYPFVWISICLILEPVNVWLGRRTFTGKLRFGDWREVMALSVGALICGFFWELWNWRSVAKWIYTVPSVDRWHIFEMPALGYAGYLPFGLECLLIVEWTIGRAWRASGLV